MVYNGVVRMSRLLLFTLSLCGVCQLIWTHVALKFPPARKYDLDFLDNIRTPGPCGMPQGDERTTLVAGSSFNVTWHLAYPHKGGYKLQLLTDDGRPWMDLTSTPSHNGFLSDDPTAQEQQIRIPRNISCKGCSIKLEREALEWSNNYLFWSCADVNIVHEDEFKEDCSGNGEFRNDACICKKLYSGSRCQYKDECWEDRDCGKAGKCINIKATTFPKKQCYCQLGFFGKNCEKESPIATTDVDLSKHQSQDLSDDFKLYWKVMKSQGEIEIVAKVKSTTYVGLGWRPRDISPNCKAFPPIEDHVVFESTVEGVGVAEPEPLPESEPSSSSTLPNPVPEPVLKEDRSRTLPETILNETEFIAHKGNVTEVDLNVEDGVVLEVTAAEPKANKNNPENDTFDGRTFSVIQDKESTPEPQILDMSKSKDQVTEATAESNRHPVTLEVSAHPMNVIVEEKSEQAKDHSYVDESSQGEVNYGVEHHSNDGLVEYVHEPQTTSSTTSRNVRLKRANEKELLQQRSDSVMQLKDHKFPNETTANETDKMESSTGMFQTEHDTKLEPSPESEPVAEFKSEPMPSTESTMKREPKFESEPTASEYKAMKSGPYTPRGDFHPMDCTDLVIGTAYGNYSRIFDYYTRDRSTPRVDSFWGGSDSLTAATGFEKDGVTTIIFRRKLIANEITDHSFVKGLMHVIWAKGQEPGAYNHYPLSGLEKGTPSTPDFYRRDELKYHGHGTQRGVATVDFLNSKLMNKHVDESKGEWKIPASCSVDDCEYRATWEYTPSQDSILFTVSTNNTDKWTGIGFSEDNKMPKTDAILGWVDDAGRTFVMDVWIDQYAPPTLDEDQNVYGIKGWKRGGRVSLSFTRKRNTGDALQDLAFTDSSCLYMMFPYDGGVFNAVSKKIRKHNSTPIVSSSKICIRGTGTSDPSGEDLNVVQGLAEITPTVSGLQPTTSPTIDSKPSSAYMVSIRLPNQTLDDAIERGIDFKMLIREGLNDYISDALQHIRGFKKAEVTALESEKNEAHVLAKMRVYIDSSASVKENSKHFIKSTVKELHKTLSATISNGKVGRLIVDPAYLVVDEPPTVLESGENELNNTELGVVTNGVTSGEMQDATLLYVIIAAVAALGFLLFVQIICMLCRCHAARRTNISKERLIVGGPGWKDYAAGTSPGNGSTYDYEHNYSAQNEDGPNVSKYPLGSTTNGTSRSGAHSNAHGANGHSKSGLNGNASNETRSLSKNQKVGLSSDPNERGHYSRRSESLPRPNVTSESRIYDARERIARPSSASSMYPQGGLQPDFYFMPSQRRYSGEVVRVYVDYNNPNYTGK